MKINDNLTNKNDFNYIDKFDFSKNDSFGMPIQNKNTKNIKDHQNTNIINQINDPRLELTLKYLDINSTLPTFITNNISFNDLLLLSKNDLVELGFSLVERNRILHFSQEFKNFGKKYNIEEINKFFDIFHNLNMRLIAINNNNNNIETFLPTNEINNINNYYNNENNYNFSNYDKNNNNLGISNSDSLYLDDKTYQNNNNINIISGNNINNKNNMQLNKNIYNYNPNNNDIKLVNNFVSSNNIKNKNKNVKSEQQFKDLLSPNINHNNNYSNYFQENNNSSKLIRQNSKASKNSSYSKNSKSRLVTISKSFIPSNTNSESVVQKYQNLSEEIDNYFKKYNDYKENKKNKMKKYQIITSSNHSKKNFQIYPNNKNYNDKKNNNKNKNYINNINNYNNNNNNIDYNENNIDNKLNNELSQKLQELKNKKQKLKEKLNTVCDKENKKKMIIKYLEEEEEK